MGPFHADFTAKSGGYVVQFKLDSQHEYVGAFNRLMKPHGSGVIISKTSIFEGNFKDGKKHGASRLIKYCISKPLVKVIEGDYEEDNLVSKTKSTYDFDGTPLNLQATLDGTPVESPQMLNIPGISYIYYWKHK